MPPGLSSLWGYMDASLATVLLPVRYVIDYVRIFGQPLFPTFFIPAHLPRQDPAQLGIGQVLIFEDSGLKSRVVETGGFIASWSATQPSQAMVLPGSEEAFDGTRQLLTWKLPASSLLSDGTLEIKLEPLPGYRYLDADGHYQVPPSSQNQRWLQIPTRRGQGQVVVAYREDGFWLGSLAALAGLLILLARLRHRASPRRDEDLAQKH